MTGKIAEISPERSKEVDEWVSKALKPFATVNNKLHLQKSFVNQKFDDWEMVLIYQNKTERVGIEVMTNEHTGDYVMVSTISLLDTDQKFYHDTEVKYYHNSFYNSIIGVLNALEEWNAKKRKVYKVFTELMEAYRTWINVHYYPIKQLQLPGITEDLPQSLPVITDELPEVKQQIPDWIKALKPGESVWVGYTDHSKWEFPDGYRMYFELEQFQSLDDDIVITNKSRVHFSYVFTTDSDFQFFYEGRNYISAEPFQCEDFVTAIDFLKGGKEVKLSKYTDKKRAHEILTLDLHFQWFELLKNKPKGKVKSKSTPKKELKETETENCSAGSVPLWKFTAETAMEIYAKAVGEDNAEQVLKPFLEYSKNDEGITFNFPEDVKVCCTYCDDPIPYKRNTTNSWLVSNASDLFYLYCIKCAEKRYIPFDHTAVRLELELESAQKTNELAAPGNNFRERYNNKKMRNRLIKQLEEMPADRRAYLIESIQQHFPTTI